MTPNCTYCDLDSAGNHELDCPNNIVFINRACPYECQGNGWICPLCGVSNNPNNPTCPCQEINT